MERYRTMRAFSAGGVIFRLVPLHSSAEESIPAGGQWLEQEQAVYASPLTYTLEVALVGRSYANIWTLPKGTPKPGETMEQVAVREVQEETGLQVRLITYVGCISYSFVRDQIRYQKQVRHFLFEAIGGDISLHDQEYDVASWFPLSEAYRHLTYQNEVYILGQAADMFQRWLEYRQREGQQ